MKVRYQKLTYHNSLSLSCVKKENIKVLVSILFFKIKTRLNNLRYRRLRNNF